MNNCNTNRNQRELIFSFLLLLSHSGALTQPRSGAALLINFANKTYGCVEKYVPYIHIHIYYFSMKKQRQTFCVNSKPNEKKQAEQEQQTTDGLGSMKKRSKRKIWTKRGPQNDALIGEPFKCTLTLGCSRQYMRMAHQSKSQDKRTNWAKNESTTKIKRHYVEKIQSVHKRTKSNGSKRMYECGSPLHNCVQLCVRRAETVEAAAAATQTTTTSPSTTFCLCAFYMYSLCHCCLCVCEFVRACVYKPIEIDLT